MSPEQDTLNACKDKFAEILSELNDSQLHNFRDFAFTAMDKYHAQIHTDEIETEEYTEGFQPVSDLKMMRLERIIKDLRTQVPISAEAPNEKIVIPNTQEFKGYSHDNTIHVDGFLFGEDDVDDMVESGKMSRNYCLDCNSKKVMPLNFISHSASVLQLQFVFQVALADLVKDKVVVDIGSRLGAVLYTGHLFTKARKLIGVEINEWFSNLQKQTVKKYKMDDRIQVICKDIQEMPELLNENADIVIMNNVFQFFNEPETQQKIWKFIRTETKKKPGMILVTLPSLQEQLKSAGLSATNMLKGWVKELKLTHDGGWFQELSDEELDDIKEVHLYKVL
ncbi:S-adenosyl-L-methionine-dependent methyltransferase [Sporodiniella umbellata]|nr:S-adenosyl-L-methionine-dependent methyltransferase [Sporodiniella umbellata]